jgi:aspartate aminotransferase-like enzyme
MEAVARQFANGKKVLVLRNGWFSYRWSQILEAGSIPSAQTVLKAVRTAPDPRAPFAPAPADQVAEVIRRERPAVVFAPHVETASGLLLPDSYLGVVGAAAKEVGALFVLDCIASGAVWVDMRASSVDVLVSAPQKGWTGSPGCAFVMLSEAARELIDNTTSTSFACDLRKWLQIMETYESGGHAYHATMPTDSLARTRDVMLESRAAGFENLRARQVELGQRVRTMLEARGFQSVAAPGFQAPGVVVSYTDDPSLASGKSFAAAGLQTAAGVPLQCDEGPDFRTFRVGLFGLDKLAHVDRTVSTLERALDQVKPIDSGLPRAA